MVTATTAARPATYEAKATTLQKFWSRRNDKFRAWYKRLRLDDNLKAPNMESFIANDPRTLYNLASHLLTASHIPHNIPLDGIPPVAQDAVAQVETFWKTSWSALDKDNRNRGRQSWMRYFTGLMLATGWYAVFVMATEEGLIADVWNPAEVYPDYSDGLSSVVHIYNLKASAARKRIVEKGWSATITGEQQVKVIDFWEYNDAGQPENTILMGGKFVKPPTPHPDLKTIPVLVSPVAGLPDNGAIDEGDESWKDNIGESIVATNDGVYENYNRQLTFLQQILRDTAQPRFKERSRTGNVLQAENVFKRGAIFKMDIDEDVGVIDMPSIPAELRTQLFDIQGMIQRGGFPWVLYGNVQQEIAGFVMSQIAAAAHQILQPYRDALSSVLTDIDNAWLGMMRDGGARPKQFTLPVELPESALFDIALKVQIPGDLAIRASTARQLAPDFRLSHTTVVDQLFPEIRDPNRELALRQRDDALSHPVAGQLALIASLREQSLALIADNQPDLARLYENAAKLAESQLQPPTPTGQPLQAVTGAA